MAGNQMGYIKAKLGLKGATKPGEMLTKLNAMKMKAGAASGVGRLEKAKLAKKKITKKII